MAVRYEYAVVPLFRLLPLLAAFQKKEAEARGYVADDAERREYENLIRRGYRWVRTDGEFAVFEKEVRRG